VSLNSIPVITLDGLSGAGKGSVGLRLAQRLGWHFLDSGLFYRLLAFVAEKQAISFEDSTQLACLAEHIKPRFRVVTEPVLSLSVIWDNHDVTPLLRTEQCGAQASKLSIYPAVRAALLKAQRDFQTPPGLIADGRDMGTIVFPDAVCKFFLTASVDIRAHRRYLQLKQQGNYASLSKLKSIILHRDNRDQSRSVAAAQPAPDAHVIDTTDLSIESVLSKIERLLSTKNLMPNRV
jgi:cytidylate kinase